MKKTKIICTLGPASSKKSVLRSMIRSGMDIARFNFSHGSHEEHGVRADMIKNLREELNIPVAMLLDTKGPEIRTKRLKDGKKVMLQTGSKFILTTGDYVGDENKVAITYDMLYKDVKKGGKILIDDGLIELEIEDIKNGDIHCKVLNGGELGERKGVNVPYVKLKLPGITEQDKEDIIFGIHQEFDFIAASFVRNAKVIREIRQILAENNASDIGIIAKIENAEGVENIDEIIQAADGIMVARGDLGVEIPASEVPHIQKEIIRKCNENYVPVITATQMLDSMIRNPRPTRAEVTDVANAIYDGTDAIMLSGETAAGKYPVEALKMMVQIAQTTEPHLNYKIHVKGRNMYRQGRVSSAVGMAAVRTARELQAKAIVTPTMAGKTALLISNFRPEVPIYAITPNERVQHRLQLLWGVYPLKGYEKDSTEHIISQAMSVVRRKRLIKKGDLVVFTAGDPATNIRTGEGAVTNMLHIMEAK
ncbi:MAG TPA: pyruvate kinase [Candidatus Blautia faecigallinarum]|uniref:Pyruvate kinase n=1 Tax=Candidatus Blautia faecigallinarum TaxID=2838488 RepID=A0A9D2DTJ4_9FIRM|nr:pyruvate kinase [Candidatus Blautia faecigallinarum]